VAALQVQVGQLFDERRSLKDNYDRLKRDNQRRMWEITKLQGENRDVKEKCNKIQEENLALKTKSTEFRLAINKLHEKTRDHDGLFLHMGRALLAALRSSK
jgi:chromosome segregation ATPase